MQHAPNLIYAIMVLKSSTETSSAKLCKTLAQKECECCRNPAQHIWVPTASRMCFECIGQRPIARDQPELTEKYRVSSADLSSLVSFTIPSVASPYNAPFSKPVTQHVWSATTLYKPPNMLQENRERKVIFGDKSTSFWWYRDDESWEPPFVSIKQPYALMLYTALSESYEAHSAVRRFVTTVIAPWLSKGEVEMGVMCSVTCRYTESQDRAYSREGFAK